MTGQCACHDKLTTGYRHADGTSQPSSSTWQGARLLCHSALAPRKARAIPGLGFRKAHGKERRRGRRRCMYVREEQIPEKLYCTSIFQTASRQNPALAVAWR